MYLTQIDLCVPLSTSTVSRLLESQPLTIHYLKKFLKSLSKIGRGISPPSRRSSRIEADLETSLTSTVHETDSLFDINNQHSTLYREQMGVDHFTGPSKTAVTKHNELSDDDDCSSIYTSRSNSQARSNSALSQDSH